MSNTPDIGSQTERKWTDSLVIMTAVPAISALLLFVLAALRKSAQVSRRRLITSEYLEQPGLCLTTRQASRLWNFPESACRHLLEGLLGRRFLVRTPEGAYCRRDVDAPPGAERPLPPADTVKRMLHTPSGADKTDVDIGSRDTRELKRTETGWPTATMAIKNSLPQPPPFKTDGRVRRAATRDHAAIQSWAERHQAEPATGEATASGPATVNINDGGVGIRFNFPSAAPFRRISWREWFDNFDRYRLVFVSEEEESASPPLGAYYLLMTEQDWRREMS